MSMPQLVGAGVSLGTSALGSLFGRKQRAADNEARQIQLNLMRQKEGIMQKQMSTGDEMAKYYNQLVAQGQGMQQMGQADYDRTTPMWDAAAGQYGSMMANPYKYTAPQVEAAQRAAMQQQQGILSRFGRGAGQQAALVGANAAIPIFAQEQAQRVRQAGLEGVTNVGNLFAQRAQGMYGLASNSFGQASGALGQSGGMYNAAMAGTPTNWQNYQSPWGEAVGSVGKLVGGTLMGMKDWKTKF